MNKSESVYIAGHNGLVGSNILKKLKELGYENLIYFDRSEYDLVNQSDVNLLFKENKPDYVFLSAAKVGGIYANNTFRGDFIYENLMIQTNIIHAAKENDTKKVLNLGSSCIYPKKSLIPITENQLLTGKLEETNEPYAISKIAGIKLAESYRFQYGLNVISLMPTNLYGPGDNFDPQNSHVLPALIQRFHQAKVENVKEVTCWGDGSPLREFLYVEDLADASIYCMQNYNDLEIINVGTGVDISIKELAELISEIIGYKGSILWDKSKPNGTHQKTLDVTKLSNLGWAPKTELSEGIKITYDWFLSNF